MPYIKQEDRKHFTNFDLVEPPSDAGELAFLLSQAVDLYLSNFDRVNYAAHAEVIGVIETLKLEIYRRFTGPYEDQKREENGEAFFYARD
jgi:hypothetical protein